jgi:hypothetical protein
MTTPREPDTHTPKDEPVKAVSPPGLFDKAADYLKENKLAALVIARPGIREQLHDVFSMQLRDATKLASEELDKLVNGLVESLLNGGEANPTRVMSVLTVPLLTEAELTAIEKNRVGDNLPRDLTRVLQRYYQGDAVKTLTFFLLGNMDLLEKASRLHSSPSSMDAECVMDPTLAHRVQTSAQGLGRLREHPIK